jgi:hypothetical protein
VDEFGTDEFDEEQFYTDELDPSREGFCLRGRVFGLALPLVVLLIVIAVVSGLVFGGVIQGHESREGAGQAPTTQATVLIVP